MKYLNNKKTELLASGLEYPEGPIYCSDGSILLVEIRGNALTRVIPGQNTPSRITNIPGGPNGAAIGPDIDGNTQVYICNDGGFEWTSFPPPDKDSKTGEEPWLWIAGNKPKDYKTGSLDRVDLTTGELKADLFTMAEKTPAWPPSPPLPPIWSPGYPLCGPDDLVFDKDGGLWFSDYGKHTPFKKDITGIYYVSPDGKSIRQAIYGLNCANGIGISPCGKWLYVALSFERKVLKYEIGEQGAFVPNPETLDGSYLLTGDFIGSSVLDSMALDSEGNLYVATMVPQGSNPTINGGITVVSPNGDILDFIEVSVPGFYHACPLPSNICFGGDNMKTAYITCGGTGHLISMPSEIPGLPLKFNC